MTDIRNYTTFNPGAPHCMENARFVSTDGKDGGGHTTCLWELDSNGHCPNADAHHYRWIASNLDQDEWAAIVCEARRNDEHWVEDNGQWRYSARPMIKVAAGTPMAALREQVIEERRSSGLDTATGRPVDSTPTEMQVKTLQSDHMTATVATESGSRYTVVARPKAGVVVIHDTAGWVRQGKTLVVLNGRMFLTDGQQILVSTTRITNIYIATN